METAEILENGQTQTVCLPPEIHFDGGRVYIKRIGQAVVLLPLSSPWQPLIDSLPLFSEDFMRDRQQPPTQNRDDVFA